MSVPLLDLKAQHATIRDEMIAALTRVADSQLFILGEEVARLEQEVAALSGTRHAIGCANGTDALLLAYRALDIGRGDEVITTPFTFFATAGAIHNVGATPVFVDIEPRTFNIDPAAAKGAVTSRTRAVVPVDLFGQMAALECLRELLPSLPIIEDAAQSIGARRSIAGVERRAGEFATIGTFSFFPSKNLGGYGDGGMLVTQDDRLAERLRRLRVHGGMTTYHHEEVGYNSRLDSLQAAVLRIKLPHLERWSERRRENAAYYSRALADVPDVVTPFIDPANTSIFNQYTLRVERRAELQAHLKARAVGNAIYYPLPLHLQPCFAHLGYTQGAFPEAERAAREVISIPVFPELSRPQQDEVIDAIRTFYRR
ncbi:MAG: DegT/DnrJ/EryC1/StrS family aminotransferase [Gemmatimonadaceae bacterium]